MKIYKHYFDKSDTPFRSDYQPKKKQDTVWLRQAYVKHIGHKVLKVKVFGIFTIYNKG